MGAYCNPRLQLANNFPRESGKGASPGQEKAAPPGSRGSQPSPRKNFVNSAGPTNRKRWPAPHPWRVQEAHLRGKSRNAASGYLPVGGQTPSVRAHLRPRSCTRRNKVEVGPGFSISTEGRPGPLPPCHSPPPPGSPGSPIPSGGPCSRTTSQGLKSAGGGGRAGVPSLPAAAAAGEMEAAGSSCAQLVPGGRAGARWPGRTGRGWEPPLGRGRGRSVRPVHGQPRGWRLWLQGKAGPVRCVSLCTPQCHTQQPGTQRRCPGHGGVRREPGVGGVLGWIRARGGLEARNHSESKMNSPDWSKKKG